MWLRWLPHVQVHLGGVDGRIFDCCELAHLEGRGSKLCRLSCELSMELWV